MKNLVLIFSLSITGIVLSSTDFHISSSLIKNFNYTILSNSFTIGKNKSNKSVENKNAPVHPVKVHSNKVNYIVVRTGDTYPEIAKEFGMGLWQLYKYNDHLSSKDHLSEGDIVYLQPKRKHSRTTKQLVLKESKTVTEISQEEAIKIESLIQMNKNITSDNQVLPKGSIVTLH